MRARFLVAPFALLSLALAACGSPSAPASPSASGHAHEPASGRGTQTSDRSPRIAVGTESGITVLGADLKEVGSFPTRERPALTTAHDGRHVVATQTDAGIVNIVDAGSWAEPHGDHEHFYVADPVLLDEALEGGEPIHVVANAEADATTVYFDAGGYAEVLTTQSLTEQELHGLRRIESKSPHHGVVVPLADGTWLATQAGDDALPDTIDWLDAEGNATATVECSDLHGEAVAGKTALFGCSDSVVQVTGGQASVIAAPDASGERVGALVAAPDGKTFVGDWAPDSLLFLRDGQAKVVDVGTEYSNLVATPDGRFAIIGTDGVVRVYSAEGKAETTFEVAQPWTKPKGHGGLAPMLAAGANAGAPTIWVSEPAANKVHAIDLFAGQVTSVDVAGQPGSIAVTNATD